MNLLIKTGLRVRTFGMLAHIALYQEQPEDLHVWNLQEPDCNKLMS
jgi:hypothetical protein